MDKWEKINYNTGRGEDKMNIINRRINYAMKFRNMRNADIIEAAKLRGVNIGSSTISQYQEGKYTPKPDKIKLLAEIFNVSYLWLLGLAPLKEINFNNGDTKEEQILLNNFRLLNKNGQELVSKYIFEIVKIKELRK